MQPLTFTLLFWIIAAGAHAQTSAACDSIYKNVDESATFPGGTAGLVRYMHKNFMPAVSECYQHDSEMVTRLSTTLVIDSKGQVTGVTIANSEIPAACQERLRKKLLTMKGWIAARRKGVSVCSYYQWAIPCILWEEEEK